MRVTNNMIMKNAASNINSTKEIVNKRNTQMTTQKKISKPSDDPVVSVRSLRLSTTLSQVTQYYEKNIPDATSWMDVTETALINMRSTLADCRTLAVNGSTDSLSQTDRNTILSQLEAYQTAIFSEANADYAGRTVFTGYRTDSNLTFTEDETDTSYDITQSLKVSDVIEQYRYYDGNVEVPTTQDEVLNNAISDTVETDYYRVRTAYDGIDEDGLKSLEITFPDGSTGTWTNGSTTLDMYQEDGTTPATDADGNPLSWTVTTYANQTDWAAATTDLGKVVGDDEIVFIEETGEFVFGANVSSALMTNDASMSFEYSKTGFDNGELRPEFYYNCVKTADPMDTKVPVTYTKFDENGDVINFDIDYAVAAGQTITVNTEASNVFDSSIQRDLLEMTNAISASIKAHDKVDTIKEMLSDANYADEEYQTKLNEWLDAAQKEADYADDNTQKLFNTEIGKIDTYYAKMNLAVTDLGCKCDSLSLTKTRMCDQQETVEELQSQNDDLDLSQIIIDYTAAYTAYQASLQAAGKLGDISLLNYI